MICKSCGTEITQGNNFCARCGAPADRQPTQPRRRKKWWLPLVIVAACVISVSALVSVLVSAGTRVVKDAYTESLWADQYNAGSYAMTAGKYEDAVDAFEEAIRIDPQREEGYVCLARAYVMMGDIRAAQQILEKGAQKTGNEALTQELDRLLLWYGS